VALWMDKANQIPSNRQTLMTAPFIDD
jgi:hypothetical protein